MKNMDLDIPVATNNEELLNLKPKFWIPPQYLHLQTTENTTAKCRLCKGNGFVFVHSSEGLVVKKYCFHCKGEREKRV